MELTLKNIGKIGDTVVQINGITVIAGQNNTGKSTVGRALFSVFNGFYNINKKINDERAESIINIFRGVVDFPILGKNYSIIEEKVIEKFISHKSEFLSSDINTKLHTIAEMLETLEATSQHSDSDLRNILNEIEERLDIADDALRDKILESILDKEFNHQVRNIFSDDIARISLKIKNDFLHVTIKTDDSVEITNEGNLSLGTEVIYIDDPFVIDSPNKGFWYPFDKYQNHQNHLSTKLYFTKEDANLLDSIITDDRLNLIYEKLSSVCSGSISRNKRLELFYSRKGTDEKLNVRNLSAGIKAFVILKMLLTNGIIRKNGTVILDEPEIHLHPEWQLVFAEIIVLLHKYFGLHILLATHSPYFLNALEVYSVKHDVNDRCAYYLATNEHDIAKLTEVSNNLESVYSELARPLQDLENVRGGL